MQEITPDGSYHTALGDLLVKEKKLLKRKKNLSYQRFLFAVLSFVLLWKLWTLSILFAFTCFFIFFSLFFFIVLRDLKNRADIENIRRLQTICKLELRILDHDFFHLPTGDDLCPPHHAYAQDLDLFGKASLYQYLNRTSSEQGHQRFADWLLEPAQLHTILQRQKTAQILSKNQEWCRQFRAFVLSNPLTIASQQKIHRWLQDAPVLQQNSWLRMIRFVFPFITLGSLLLFIFSYINGTFFTFLIIAFYSIASYFSKKYQLLYTRLDKIVPELETLEHSIRMIENQEFDDELMSREKNKLKSSTNSASGDISQLKKILARLDYRYNPIIHIPLNSFFCWDLQQLFSLEKWKETNRYAIPLWFDAVAETEALVSLGTIAFNHPDWSFPKLSPEKNNFIGHETGHPLLSKKVRVNNFFSSQGTGHINLVTGSNMAGKSTFLRSVGLNIVLAMMGSPVCCKELTVSVMKVMSSMRVNDNLEENTSTFYAELKKLKEIIEAIKNRENIFILLDEILRGTNSTDQHTGSLALLKQLIRDNASGIVATHDLELAKLALEYPDNFHNYHFDVQVKNEELYFDYTIKNGICKSMNASLLMKKIGIEL